MKSGDTFVVDLEFLFKPLIGRLIDFTLQDGEQVTARVISVESNSATVSVVPKGTKE